MTEKWENWTWKELRRYAVAIRGMNKSTWEGRKGYLEWMEKEYGVDLHADPDTTYQQFLDYVEKQRMDFGRKADNRIKHARNALKLLFSFYGTEGNYEWPRVREVKPTIILPSDSVVYQHIHGRMDKNPLMSLQINYIFHQGYVLGPRPGAIPLMKIGGINFDTLQFVYYEPKVGRDRKVHLPEFVMTSPVDKSLKNWIEHHRPKIATEESGDYLWLNLDGTPLNPTNFLKTLRKRGKTVWKGWYPYLMRHYAFTRFLVEGYKRFGVFPILELKNYADHDSIKNTLRYVHLAEELVENTQRRMDIGRLKVRQAKNIKGNALSKSKPGLPYKSGRAHFSQQIEFPPITTPFSQLSISTCQEVVL